MYSGSYQYIGEDEISAFFIDEFSRAKQELENRGAKVYLIYPPLMKNPTFDLDNPTIMNKIKSLQKQLKEYGLQIIGNPRDFYYEPDFFFDTAYHLNCSGAKKRTEKFLEIIKNSISLRLPNPQDSKLPMESLQSHPLSSP